MLNTFIKSAFSRFLFAAALTFFLSTPGALAKDAGKGKGPPPVPVRVAKVEKKMVSEQISLIGTTEAIATSTVASEASGVVEYFTIKEGDFVKKGELLVRLKSIGLNLRLKAAAAEREKIRANLQNAQKELERVSKLKDTNSVAEKRYDDAHYAHLALSNELLRSEADIERLKYDIQQKKVIAPFSGFVAKEHTQVGEWINAGGPVITLVDLGQVRITVDVPERYVVMLKPRGKVKVTVKSMSSDPLLGNIFAVLRS